MFVLTIRNLFFFVESCNLIEDKLLSHFFSQNFKMQQIQTEPNAGSKWRESITLALRNCENTSCDSLNRDYESFEQQKHETIEKFAKKSPLKKRFKILSRSGRRECSITREWHKSVANLKRNDGLSLIYEQFFGDCDGSITRCAIFVSPFSE